MAIGNPQCLQVAAIRTLIADDHQLMRSQIAAILSENLLFDICGQAKDGNEAVHMAQELRPQLVILDMSMPGLNGLDAAAQIRQIFPSAKIIILTMHEGPQLAVVCQKAGADAVVPKRLITTMLIDTANQLFLYNSVE